MSEATMTRDTTTIERIAYNQTEAAAALGWSEPTLRDKEKQGLIRSTKIGKSRLYLVDDLKRLARYGNANGTEAR